MRISRYATMGLIVSISALTLGLNLAKAEDVKKDFGDMSVGVFIKTATFEPYIEGEADCQDMSLGVCTGGAVAALSDEFPDFGSDLVRDMAFNLASTTPFLDQRLRNAKSVSVNTASLDEGFDLKIPVNAKATTTAKVDILGGPSDFVFDKSYQRLTF